MTRLLEAVVFTCFFLSGASALVYEVVWLRWLVHVFGATTLAVSAILAAFMGGLALGSWLGGRAARHVTRPLAAYGLLEGAVCGYALLLPWLLQGVVPSLLALGVSEASSFTAVSLVRFGLTLVILIPPTACMGATLPLLARFAASRPDTRGRRAGLLYAVNTAGAVLGTAAAGFLLLPTVGVMLTNALAAALSGAIGVAAVLVGARADLPPAAVPGNAPPGAPAPRPGTAPPPDTHRRLAVGASIAIAVSGGLALAYEVAWTRALSLVLGSSVYAFTVMLTTFLVGLAGGSYLVARRVDRQAEPGLVLGLLQVGIGVAAFAGLFVLEELPYLFVRLFAASGGHHARFLALQFLVTGAIILPPALLSGAVFPVCVRLAAHHGTEAGRSVGSLYALNTLGAIIGSFVGGFVLIPLVGIRGTLVVAILLNIALAFGLLLTLPVRRRALATRLAIALPLLAIVVTVAAPQWKPLTMASGVAVSAPRLQRVSRSEFRRLVERPRLWFYEEGLTTTVSVEEQGGRLALRVNGKMDASTGIDMPNQVLISHLALLFHPDPRDVLVIGLGSGVTAGSVLAHPVRAMTVVEIERAVVRASRLFDPVNGRPLDDPRSRLVVNDARSFLALTAERFDIIISEPSNPWLTGVASLFTEDFFRLTRARLRPGGIFAQWVQLYGLTPDMLRSILATFSAVFPQAVVFRTSIGDTVLVGSPDPLRLDLASVERRVGAPRVLADLRRVGVRHAADLLAHLVLDVEDVPRFAEGAPLNTDDNAHVEFAAPRTLYSDATLENARRMAAAFRPGGSVLTPVLRVASEEVRARLAERFGQRGQPDHAAAAMGRPAP